MWDLLSYYETRFVRENYPTTFEMLQSIIENKDIPFIDENETSPMTIFMHQLLSELYSYGKELKLSECKIFTLMSVIFKTHIYYLMNTWDSLYDVNKKFLDIILDNSLLDCCHRVENIEPEDLLNILSFFHEKYLKNLPLVELYIRTQRETVISFA